MVNLTRTWIRHADFSGAHMEGVQFGELPVLEEDHSVSSTAYSQDGESFAVLESGDINVYNITNNASIDFSQPTSSGTDALLEPGLPRNGCHFGPSNPQGLGEVQSGSSMSSSFQQDIQLSFTNDDSLAADTSAMLLRTPGTDVHQMVDDPASSFEVIYNNGESHSMVVSDLQDDGALVVNLDADQSATNNPTDSARRFPCPYPGCTKPPFTKKGNMKNHLSTHLGVPFPCPYTGCDKVYRRYGDRFRHIQFVHWGRYWSCDHCLKVYVRKPTVGQMPDCIKNKGGSHAFRKYDKSSASSSVSVAVYVP